MSRPLYQDTELTRLRGVERQAQNVQHRTRGINQIIDDSDVAYEPRDTVHFVGATVADDATNLKTTVTMGGGGSGDYIFAPTQQVNLFNGGFNRDGDLNYVKTDATLPFNAFLNNFQETAFGGAGGSTTASNGDLFYARFALGPQGSTWKFQIGYVTGPDFGKLQFGLASNAETYNPADGRGTAGRLQPSTGGAAATYTEPLFWTIDGYTAAGGSSYDGLAVVQIGGTAGTAQTSMTSHTGYFGGSTGYESNGGPGIYTLRLRVNGKSGSSSGYKVGLWNVSAMRIAGDNSQD